MTSSYLTREFDRDSYRRVKSALRRAAPLLLGVSLMPDAALAQAANPATTVEHPAANPAMPSWTPVIRPLAPVPTIAAPAAAPPAPAPRVLSAGVTITAKAFDIAGCTVFAQETLAAVVKPFLGRAIDSEDLEDLRLRLTRLYVDAGFINSGVIIPDQDVGDGTIRLQAIEGSLGEIRVSGNAHLRPAYLEERLRRGAGTPLNVLRLQERMQLLLADATVGRINAELRPSDRPGVGIVEVDIDEGKRFALGGEIANSRNPNVGELRLGVSASARNLVGWNDQWAVRLGKTRGIDDYSFFTAHPVTADETTLSLRQEKNNSVVVEAPFDTIDIRGDSITTEIGLRSPLRRTALSEFALGAYVARRSNRTRLGDEAFDFTPGSHAGKSVVAALRLTAEWLSRSPSHVTALRLAASRGLRAFGATINPDGIADSRFSALAGQGQWLRVFAETGGEIAGRAGFQKATGRLLPQEKFGLGGMDTVRGFRENFRVRDNGGFASIEYRQPLRARTGAAAEMSEPGRWLALAFADAGTSWDDGGAKDSLWSAGPGIRWESGREVQATVYWAAARKKVEHGDSLQDRGLHFKIEVQRSF